MINRDKRTYDFFTFGENDAYAQSVLSETPQGTIKIAIYPSSQNIQDNINYKDCNYIGLTTDKVTDRYVIAFGNEKLKVLYVVPKGRQKTVFLKRI